MCFGLIGCNSIKKPVTTEELKIEDSVELDIGEEFSSIDAPLRLSSNGFTDSGYGNIFTIITATIKPERLSSTTYLYWTFYDVDNVPDELSWSTSHSDDIIDLDYTDSSALASHECRIGINGAFKGKTYKVRCSTRSADYAGLDAEITIKYKGAPSSFVCNDGDIVSASTFVLTEGAQQKSFDFRYSNYFDELGSDYVGDTPHLLLNSVVSRYTVGMNTFDIYMVFKFTAVTSGYVYLRLADYYTLFIEDNMTPTTVQPVVSTFNIKAVSSPDNLNCSFNIGDINGVISDFKGYCVSPAFNQSRHYYDDLQACTFIDHEAAFINFNMTEQEFGGFSIKFRVEPILAGIELGIDEILI